MTAGREWTGREATALRKTLRLTVEAFASRIGASPRSVANWAAQPDMVPRPAIQRELDQLLDTADDDVQARFAAEIGLPAQPQAHALRVAIAVVLHGSQVLLVRRRNDNAGLIWQFPAGIIKPGEQAENVAIRETLAETGVHCTVRRRIGTRLHPVTGVLCDYLECEYLTGEAINRDDVENAGVAWADRNDTGRFIPRANIYPPVLELLEDVYAAG